MAAFVESGEQAGREASALYRNVTALLRHPLRRPRGRPDGRGAPGAPQRLPEGQSQLRAAAPWPAPAVRGKPASLEEAIRAAADLIREARLPLRRARHRRRRHARGDGAADRAGGVVDHALSGALAHNVTVLQTSGWITSTLTEARNRADLFIIVGSDVHRLHRASSSASSAPTSRCSTRCCRSAPSSSSARASTLPARRGRASAR